MPHDHNHPKLELKNELRTPQVQGAAIAIYRLLTNGRGAVDFAVKQLKALKDNRGEDYEQALNSFNISKEELEATLLAFERLLNDTDDWC